MLVGSPIRWVGVSCAHIIDMRGVLCRACGSVGTGLPCINTRSCTQLDVVHGAGWVRWVVHASQRMLVHAGWGELGSPGDLTHA